MRIKQLTNSIETDILPGLNYSSQIVVDRIANYSLTEQYTLQGDPAIRQKLHAAILASRDYTTTLLAQFAATISTPEERQLLESFRPAQDLLVGTGQTPGLWRASKGREELIAGIDADLYPAFEEAQSAAAALVDHNKEAADASTQSITDAVTRAKVAVLVSVGVGLAIAFAFGFTLLRAITRPLARLVGILDVIRPGDMSGRLTRERDDEFGTVATGSIG